MLAALILAAGASTRMGSAKPLLSDREGRPFVVRLARTFAAAELSEIVVVTAAVLAGFVLVTVEQPFILWLAVAVASVVYRSIGSLQILMINNQNLPKQFRVSKLNKGILWFSFVTGLLAVGIWAVNELPKRLGMD